MDPLSLLKSIIDSLLTPGAQQATIVVNSALFSAWLFFLLMWANAIAFESRVLGFLNKKVITPDNVRLARGDPNPEGFFRRFVFKARPKWIGLSEERRDPVSFRIFLAIASSGLSQKRLDLEETLVIAEERFEKFRRPLHQILSLFIVIGLLGTLIGIGLSFFKMSGLPSLQGQSGFTDAQATRDLLGNVLASLKNAFTPSLIGVLLSSLGLVLFTLVSRIQEGYLSTLRDRAIRYWIPTFFSSATDQVAKTIEDSAAALTKAVQIIAEASVKIKKSTEQTYTEFQKEVLKAAQALSETVNGSAKALADLSGQAAGSLAGLDTTLGEMKSNAKDLQEIIKRVQKSGSTVLETSEQLNKQFVLVTQGMKDQNELLGKILERQNEGIDKLFGEWTKHAGLLTKAQEDMKADFNATHVELRTLITAEAEKIESTKNAIAEQNQQLKSSIDKSYTEISGLMTLLRGDLTPLLKSIPEKMDQTNTALRNMKEPIGVSAKQIEDTFANFQTRATTLWDTNLKDIQNTYSQTASLIEKMKLPAPVIEQLADSVQHLNQNIVKLIRGSGPVRPVGMSWWSRMASFLRMSNPIQENAKDGGRVIQEQVKSQATTGPRLTVQFWARVDREWIKPLNAMAEDGKLKRLKDMRLQVGGIIAQGGGTYRIAMDGKDDGTEVDYHWFVGKLGDYQVVFPHPNTIQKGDYPPSISDLYDLDPNLGPNSVGRIVRPAVLRMEGESAVLVERGRLLIPRTRSAVDEVPDSTT